MINIGLELEGFTKVNNIIVPAHTVTHKVDNCQMIAELQSKHSGDIYEQLFQLEKEIFKLQVDGTDFNYNMNVHKFTTKELQNLRNVSTVKEPYKEFSIYNKAVSKVLPRGVYKTSLQINLSNNDQYYEKYYDKETHTEIVHKRVTKTYSNVFNFYQAIKYLDDQFEEEIKEAKRIPGIYCIKSGIDGKRIEYRSLPSSIFNDKLKLSKVLRKTLYIN